MVFDSMIKAFVPFVAGLGAVVVGVAAMDGLRPGTPASPVAELTREFLIAGQDGYGTNDCLAEAGDCGQVIADGWCAAQGFSRAIAYGPLGRDEITGSTREDHAVATTYRIACTR